MKYPIIHAERELRYHENLKNQLAIHKEFEFIDHCCYLDSALQSLNKYKPAILITASKLYDDPNVVEAFCNYRDAHLPELKVIVLTSKDNLDHFLQSIVQGVEGYVHKTSPEEIYQCLQSVIEGDNYLGLQKQTIETK